MYVAVFTEPAETEEDIDDGGEDDNGDDGDADDDDTGDDDDDDDSGDGDQEEIENYTLIEYGTTTWCPSCPEAAKYIHELYEENNYKFYYLSMVGDVNSKADNRLAEEYNVYGYPTVYFDGGYKTIVGKDDIKSKLKEEISDTQKRNRANIFLNIESEWNETRKELKNTVLVENREKTSYDGTLKIFITEIRGRWPDNDNNPIEYAFIDYGYNDDIELDSGENITISEIWNSEKSGFNNVISGNLFIIGAVFNSVTSPGYSKPDDNTNPFDAHYADVVDATNITEGKLPPSIAISSISNFYRYIFGQKLGKTLTGNTLIIGEMPISVKILAESGVEKVEFTIQGKFTKTTETVAEAPYEFVWDELALGKYTISVKLTDKDGYIATDSIEVVAFIIPI
jgi:thiol-disulfide isomerase/thioredoxin